MKKTTTSLLLFLYLGYLSVPMVSAGVVAGSNMNAALCGSVDHHLNANPCSENTCSKSEFSGHHLFPSHQHLVSQGKREQLQPIAFLLNDDAYLLHTTFADHHRANIAKGPAFDAAPVYLLNRVFRL